MKRLALSIIFTLIAFKNNAYTPIIYINGQPHNAGLAYGITALQDLMAHKPKKFRPGFQIISTTLVAQQDDDLEYGSAINTWTYNQKLDGFAKGLFFQAIAPLVIVSNKLDTRFVAPDSLADLSLLIQNSGFADITLLLGYRLFDTPAYQAALNFDVIIPTQQHKHSFDQINPTIGNGGHVGLGASIDGNVRIVGHEKHNLSFAAEAHYHYLIEAHKQHLLGLNRVTKANINQALIGHAIQLIPTHNATVADVTVSSASNVDAGAAFTYHYHKFFLNIGCLYHFNASTTIKAENIDLLDDSIFDQTFDKYQLNGKTVDPENIDTKNRRADVPETHLLRVNGNIGFACKEWIMPILEIPYAYSFIFGGTATAAQSNTTASWDLYIKSGVSF